jgi:hypothetical protein
MIGHFVLFVAALFAAATTALAFPSSTDSGAGRAGSAYSSASPMHHRSPPVSWLGADGNETQADKHGGSTGG